MVVHTIFAIISENIINSVCVGDYGITNDIAHEMYGADAFAIEVTQYPVEEGDHYEDGEFRRYAEDGTYTVLEYIPTDSQEIATLKAENETLKANSAVTFLAASFTAASFTDDQAIQVKSLYPEWEEGKAYAAEEIVRYGIDEHGGSQLYRVSQAHTSQADWTPDKTPSLYKAIGFTPSGVAIWVQPEGAHDAYKQGDIVSHKDKLWTSDVDGNVWEPGVYGWSEKA